MERKQRKRGARKAPSAADAQARHKLEVASEAVGMEPDAFLSMLVDTGLIGLPPTDKQPIVQTYTLKDLGLKLWCHLQEVPPSERVGWWKGLGPKQRAALVVSLKMEGFTSEVIAREFEVEQSSISSLWNEYCDQVGSQVVGLRLTTIAGHLQSSMETAQAQALREENASLFWKISKEFVGVLQELGIVDRAIHKVEHTHTHKMEDQRKAEVDGLVALELKKKRFAEESQIVDAEFFESPPPLTTDYDSIDRIRQTNDVDAEEEQESL